MLRAVTLSRSPPLADTTMIATPERSLICLHSSNPSTSGSIRSSSTISGSSVSSSCSAREPSAETTVSKPRTARLDLIRSTMFGSSSTTRARVFEKCSAMLDRLPNLGASHRPYPVLDRQPHREARSRLIGLHAKPTTVSGDDTSGDGQAEAGAAGLAAAPPSRLERRCSHFRRQADTPVTDRYADSGAVRWLGNDGDQGARRIVAYRIGEQVDEDLLEPVMIGPDHGQTGCAADPHHRYAVRRQAGHRCLEYEFDIAPIRLKPQYAELDRREVEHVVDEAANSRRLGSDSG